LKHKAFVGSETLDLVNKGCIEEVSHIPFCCNPSTVAEGKKLRLVLDLRHVNEYVSVNKFKYEDLRTVAEMINKNDFYTTFDLKSGYHHVEINPNYQKYLGFQ